MITSVWSGPGQPWEQAEAIVREVFLDELQADPSHVFDAQDPYSYHLVLQIDGTDVAAGRLSYVKAGLGQIGCIAVRRNWRHQGLGDALVKVLMYRAWDLELRRVRVLARESAVGFYERLGFARTGEHFAEDGTEKYWMERDTDDGTGDHCSHQCACAQGKTDGLTPEETAERDRLRKEYIASVRKNLIGQLENTYIVEADGTKRKLQHK